MIGTMMVANVLMLIIPGQRKMVNAMTAGQKPDPIHGIKASRIDLHINSLGGFVFDAVSMFEALQAHPAQVAVHIDGLAASAASSSIHALEATDESACVRGPAKPRCPAIAALSRIRRWPAPSRKTTAA